MATDSSDVFAPSVPSDEKLGGNEMDDLLKEADALIKSNREEAVPAPTPQKGQTREEFKKETKKIIADMIKGKPPPPPRIVSKEEMDALVKEYTSQGVPPERAITDEEYRALLKDLAQYPVGTQMNRETLFHEMLEVVRGCRGNKPRTAQAIAHLLQFALTQTNLNLYATAALQLSFLGTDALPAIAVLADDAKVERRRQAFLVLGQMGDQGSALLPVLARSLNDTDRVRNTPQEFDRLLYSMMAIGEKSLPYLEAYRQNLIVKTNSVEKLLSEDLARVESAIWEIKKKKLNQQKGGGPTK